MNVALEVAEEFAQWGGVPGRKAICDVGLVVRKGGFHLGGETKKDLSTQWLEASEDDRRALEQKARERERLLSARSVKDAVGPAAAPRVDLRAIPLDVRAPLVDQVKKRLSVGESYRHIAKCLGVHRGTVARIAQGGVGRIDEQIRIAKQCERLLEVLSELPFLSIKALHALVGAELGLSAKQVGIRLRSLGIRRHNKKEVLDV